ncbi:hypothetical protein GW750_09420 [bacterium]|nr:hypothetical protein [bacterium]
MTYYPYDHPQRNTQNVYRIKNFSRILFFINFTCLSLMNNKTTELRTSILETIQNLNISTHLFVDCKKFLDCLNWYKIKNIHQNLNDFLQHIMDVNNAIVIREQKESEQKKSDSECTS